MYTQLIADSKENREMLQKYDKCDKYDYIAAVGCGAIGGIIDIFLVGAPGNSTLGNWTDKQIDNIVISFSKKMGWKPAETKSNNVKSAIGFLERNFRVNYDQRHTADVGNIFSMSARDHHMKSLAHSPDPIGLFFSILNQFTNTAAFLDGGEIIMINSSTSELQGGNFVAKLFCGIVNWFGHLMSDVAGSSGAIGRGSGIVIPFYELFGLCNFGEFNVGKDKQNLATIAVRAFKEGYDFRFGVAQAIPIVIMDLSIRLIWSLRRHFQYGMPVKDCVPTRKHADLRVMLLIGNGTLCVMDGVEAGIMSGGNALVFFMRLNIIAWFRFAILVLKEVFIRVGIQDVFQCVIESYKRINEALLSYLYELETIDISLFKQETEKYNRIVNMFTTVTSDEELAIKLLDVYEDFGFNKPWKGDFDEFMSNKESTLVFE